MAAENTVVTYGKVKMESRSPWYVKLTPCGVGDGMVRVRGVVRVGNGEDGGW